MTKRGRCKRCIQKTSSPSLSLYLVEFENDAADTPDITRVAPSQFQDNLWRPVVPGADHRAVVLPLEGGGPEVDQFDSGIAHSADGFALVEDGVVQVPIVGHEQHVLGLQVRVSHLEIKAQGFNVKKKIFAFGN